MPEKRKRVLLFLARGFEEYEAAVFTDVMGWSRTDGETGVDLVTTALGTPVSGCWNFVVQPQRILEAVDHHDFDALAIPGGFEEKGYYEDVYQEEVTDLIQAFHADQKPIAAVCTGALALGHAGILDGRSATTYHSPASPRRSQLARFGARVMDASLVVDGHLVTCHGPAAALEVAFALLEMLTGEENVAVVKRAMGF